MSVFDVSFEKLSVELMPTFLRNPLLIAFLRAKGVPVRRIYREFRRQQDEVFFLLKYNSSTRNVELALRQRFNDAGIRIENVGAGATGIVRAHLPEFLPFYLDREIKEDDFVFRVPQATFRRVGETAIRNFANLFVLPAFQFSIREF
jgi:hypothetical protein